MSVLLAFVAAAVGEFFCLVSIIWAGISHWGGVMMLIAFLVGGLALIFRLVQLLIEKGALQAEKVPIEKRMMSMIVAGLGACATGLCLLGCLSIIIELIKWYDVYVDYGVVGEIFGYLIVRGMAGLAHALSAILEVKAIMGGSE